MRARVELAAVILGAASTLACGTIRSTLPGSTTARFSSGGDTTGSEGFARPEKAWEQARQRQPPARPSDPWSSVDGDRPRGVPDDDYAFTREAQDCSAAHDHCMPPWMWILEGQHSVDGGTDRIAVSCWWKRGETACRTAPPPGYTAYRTVPATRRMLVQGSLAVALDYPSKAPASEEAVSQSYWNVGVVASVDWTAGKVFLVGHDGPYWISAARVPVLAWKEGGKVEIIGKRSRDQLAVAADEVVQPANDVARVADPWSQVGKDGAPIEPKDTVRLERKESVRCDAAHDHCLRPWAWFTEDGPKVRPVMFKNGTMNQVFDIDRLGAVNGKAMSYRTVPATGDNLKQGALAFFTQSDIQHESDAFSTEWLGGTVVEVQPEAGVFKVEGDSRYWKIRHARVAVIAWFPGEKAEKLP